MLNLVMKAGDQLQIGDNVVIRLQSDNRAQLAIDAPREVNIKRIAADRGRSMVHNENGAEKAVR